MFKKPIVFVVGAGASAEYNMPVGSQLKAQIAEDLAFSFDFNELVGGSPSIYDFLQQHCPPPLDNYINGGSELAKTIDSFVSVDEALHFHSANPKIVEIGKLAIARRIFDAERHSGLYNAEGNIPQIKKESWLFQLMSMLLGFTRLHTVENLFNNTTIINFNYDRIFEQFMYIALQSNASCSQEVAKYIINGANIIRPYGSVGRLPWQGIEPNVAFGETNFVQKLTTAAQAILTYAEQRSDAGLHDEVKKSIKEAAVVVFLGFGFHPQNMEILSIPSAGLSKFVFATGSGINKNNYSKIGFRIGVTLQTGADGGALFDMRAGELLRELRFSIMDAAG